MPYANNKGADQPAHPRSLISTFVAPSLDSIIPAVSISEISSPYLASLAVQASLVLTWSQTPKTGFLVTRLVSYYRVTLNTVNTGKFFTIFRLFLPFKALHRAFIVPFPATQYD